MLLSPCKVWHTGQPAVSHEGKIVHVCCTSSSASGGTEMDQTRTDHSVNDQRIAYDIPLHISEIF